MQKQGTPSSRIFQGPIYNNQGVWESIVSFSNRDRGTAPAKHFVRCECQRSQLMACILLNFQKFKPTAFHYPIKISKANETYSRNFQEPSSFSSTFKNQGVP